MKKTSIVLCCLAAAGLIVRCFYYVGCNQYILDTSARILGDTNIYRTIALNIISGNGIVLSESFKAYVPPTISAVSFPPFSACSARVITRLELFRGVLI